MSTAEAKSSSAEASPSSRPGVPPFEDGQVVLLPIERIKPSRHQVRHISKQAVREMADALKAQGLLQPVEARPVEGGWELIFGHCRLAAFQLLHSEATTAEEKKAWAHIRATVKLALSDVEAALRTAAENFIRKDGTVLEQARSCLHVKTAGNLSNAAVAERLAMNKHKVDRLIRLAEAPNAIQEAVWPGVRFETTDAEGCVRTHTVPLDYTLALSAASFRAHLLAEALKVLKLKKGQRDVRAEKEAAGAADARIERLLQRAARHQWTKARMDAEVQRLMGGGADLAEGEGSAEEEGEASEGTGLRHAAFRRTASSLVLYPANLTRAPETERRQLLASLEEFMAKLKAGLASTSVSPPSSNVAT